MSQIWKFLPINFTAFSLDKISIMGEYHSIHIKKNPSKDRLNNTSHKPINSRCHSKVEVLYMDLNKRSLYLFSNYGTPVRRSYLHDWDLKRTLKYKLCQTTNNWESEIAYSQSNHVCYNNILSVTFWWKTLHAYLEGSRKPSMMLVDCTLPDDHAKEAYTFGRGKNRPKRKTRNNNLMYSAWTSKNN